MNIKKMAFITGLFLIVCLLTAPIWVDRLIVGSFHSDWERGNVAPIAKEFYTHLEEFEKDIEILRPKLSFLNNQATSDAGKFLNPRVTWEFSEQDQVKSKEWATKIESTQRILIPEATKTMLQNAKQKFLDLDPEKFSNVKTEWLQELRGFDYWDIDKNGPLDMYPRFSYGTPFPTFDVHSPKIHLIKASKGTDAEFTQTVMDVLHYAKLCFSTETLIGEMVFVSILGTVKIAVDARPSLRANLGEWASLIEEKDRLKRMLWAMNHFARPHYGADMNRMKQIYLKQNFSTGICAAIRETTTGDWMIWSALSDSMPTEFETYKTLVTNHSNGCRLTWLKDKTPPWVRLPHEPASLYSSGQAFQVTSTLDAQVSPLFMKLINFFSSAIHYMPNTRRFIGAILMSISTPTFTKGYGETLPSRNAASEPHQE